MELHASRAYKHCIFVHPVFLRNTSLSLAASNAVLFSSGEALISHAFWKSPVALGAASKAKILVPPEL